MAFIDIGDGQVRLTGVPLDDLEASTPLGRVGTPSTCRCVYLLCLPEAGYITGEVLVVGGGWVPLTRPSGRRHRK